MVTITIKDLLISTKKIEENNYLSNLIYQEQISLIIGADD